MPPESERSRLPAMQAETGLQPSRDAEESGEGGTGIGDGL